MPKSASYHTFLIKSLKDPKEADAYLNSTLEDGNLEVILCEIPYIAAVIIRPTA